MAFTVNPVKPSVFFAVGWVFSDMRVVVLITIVT